MPSLGEASCLAALGTGGCVSEANPFCFLLLPPGGNNGLQHMLPSGKQQMAPSPAKFRLLHCCWLKCFIFLRGSLPASSGRWCLQPVAEYCACLACKEPGGGQGGVGRGLVTRLGLGGFLLYGQHLVSTLGPVTAIQAP